MELSLIVLALSYLSVLIPFQAASAGQESASPQVREKLKAFARTFGYVRYFHPSDQASLVDWDGVALHGATEALASPADESARDFLTRIFDPLVFDLEVYRGAKRALPVLTEANGSKVLAWHHSGVYLSGRSEPTYRSERTERRFTPKGDDSFGVVAQGIDAGPLQGKLIRYRFQAKVIEGSPRLQGWLRADLQGGGSGLFDNMDDRPVRTREWQAFEITGTVDETATGIAFGVFLIGNGAGLVDDVVLEEFIEGTWTELTIQNGDFEEGSLTPSGWTAPENGYESSIETTDIAQGTQCLRLAKNAKGRQGGFLKVSPRLGEVIDVALAVDLRVRIPLALPAATEYFLGEDAAEDAEIEELSRLAQVDTETLEPRVLCLGNVVITWNVFQHFYPYFDQVETDWDRALEVGLAGALTSSSREQSTEVLSRLVAQLHDGHGNVADPQQWLNSKYTAAKFDWIEDRVVVTHSAIDQLRVGDVVAEVFGQDPLTYLERKEKMISGSPQWKRVRSTDALSRGQAGDNLKLKIERDDSEVELPYEKPWGKPASKLKIVDLLEGAGESDDAIYYVDMTRAEEADVRPWIEELARADGVVFDLRGYPRGTHFLFQHLTEEPLQSQKWQIPQQIRPDRDDMTQFNTEGRWLLPPQEPRFEGKAVFLTNASAISYAESCMSIVAHYKLGEIVGSPTAGANGNINPFPLPGGWSVSWTGMRVVNHDDSQHHVRGVQPTVPLKPTIQGIREGRDELLEKALEIIRG